MPSSVQEPVLDINEIQGFVIPGFTKPHQTLLGIQVPTERLSDFKKVLRELADEIATAGETLGNRRAYRKQRMLEETRYPQNAPASVFAGMGFSYAMLLRLAPDAAAFPSDAFRLGLARRSALLGDPTDVAAEGHPSNWVVGAPGAELDALVVVAGDVRTDLDSRVHDLSARFQAAGTELLYNEDGNRRSDLPGHEMFGFEDSISQPGIRGRASDQPADFITERYVATTEVPASQLFGYPGQDLVWPGVLILGYPASSPDPLIAGPPSPAMPQWTRNGSFLVFRRLRQDVGLFWRTMRDKAAELARQPGFTGMTDERLASLLLGRWPSGAPFNRVPAADNPQLGVEQLANNNFRFDSDTFAIPTTSNYQDPFPMAKADPAGITCPWAAHIRKVNTRDSGSDMGGRDSTYKRRILRLGLPFGQPLADRYAPKSSDPQKGNRGLLFLSAQASIEDQFEFLVSRWINDAMRPKAAGNDMFVGQNNAPGERRVRSCTLLGSGLQQAEFATDQDWVIPTGGGYFFVPSISTIRNVLAAE